MRRPADPPIPRQRTPDSLNRHQLSEGEYQRSRSVSPRQQYGSSMERGSKGSVYPARRSQPSNPYHQPQHQQPQHQRQPHHQQQLHQQQQQLRHQQPSHQQHQRQLLQQQLRRAGQMEGSNRAASSSSNTSQGIRKYIDDGVSSDSGIQHMNSLQYGQFSPR